jgi:putative membrane protein
MKLRITTMLAMAATVLTAAPVMAQVQISSDGRPERIFNPRAGLNDQDVHFLKMAACINMFEIQAGQVAASKSSNAFVTEYAKEMSHEHAESLEEVKNIAAAKGVDLPQSLPPDMNHLLLHLENLSGDQFDLAYQNCQGTGHVGASDEFKTEIENGKDEDVKSYAVKTLPEVELHYRMLLLKQTMMGPTKMDHGN